MDILIQILQLLLSLSILVVVHEFGHFIAAKAFNTRVEKFYLFFNPWFSLFKFNFKGTEYGMGWLPLGGYVKISGMIDESMDKEQLAKDPEPWEFRSKPAWQRLIIMVGGVTMNVILAYVIYIGMLSFYGEKYLPTSEVNKYGIVTDELSREFGLLDGDKILSVEGKYIDDFQRIPISIILEEAKSLQIERNGNMMEITLPEGAIGKLVKHESAGFLSFRTPFIIEGFGENSPAQVSGIQKGDTIIGLNDQIIPYFQDFRLALQEYKNQEVHIVLKREQDTLSLPVAIPENGLLGVYARGGDMIFDLHQKDFSLLEAVPAGFAKTIDGIGGYLKQLKLLASPEVKAYESVGGFITIGSIFPKQWHWESFWRLTAFLSIMLAVLNLLPIPALDGGHVMFLFYEIIARRKPSDKFMEYAQIVGMVILFGLLIFANGNDILKLFR